MSEFFRVMGALAGLLAFVPLSVGAQAVHEVRMVSTGKSEYRFVPSSVSARPGDVLLFKSVSGGPHSVVFEAKGLAAEDHQKVNASLPRRAGDLSSPLLTDGAEYRVVVPALAPGTYRFFCLPHRAYDMRGELVIR